MTLHIALQLTLYDGLDTSVSSLLVLVIRLEDISYSRKELSIQKGTLVGHTYPLNACQGTFM